MPENAFAGQATQPTERELASVLNDSHPLWQNLVADLKKELNLDRQEWNSYSVKAGWSLRLQSKKRNIVYLSPRAGSFLASFALGDKAVAAARKSNLPPHVLKIVNAAKRYAEGAAVRIEVRAAKDVDVVKTLAKIKLEN
jgi:Protein of unknown function (DUF3788)